jgi:GntR family transcriptional repressor for pyruvate dehydrogenase complex
MTTVSSDLLVEPRVPDLRPVGSRPYLRQDAADELRRFIMDANLPPGTRLPSERELCARLSLGRNSLREGMRFLEHEGLLEIRQGRPAVVRPLDLTPMIEPVLRRLAAQRGVLRDLMEVRAPLEVLAARGAAEHRSESDLHALRLCLDSARDQLDRGGQTLDEDVLFHDLLYRASGNTVLLAFSRTVQGLLRSVREAGREVGASPERSWEDHAAIYDAVAAAAPDEAATAMEHHMNAVRTQQAAALEMLEVLARDTAGEKAEER